MDVGRLKYVTNSRKQETLRHVNISFESIENVLEYAMLFELKASFRRNNFDMLHIVGTASLPVLL